MNLKNLDTANLKKHIEKTILKYDSNGLNEKFLCVYYDGDNFDLFSKKYLHKITNDMTFGFLSTIDESENLLEHTEIKIYKTIYERTSKRVFLYHILINL
jgi:GGDEF domain-containing protein